MLITISVIENGTPCWCYYAHSILIPRHKEKSLAEIFNFKKFSRVFDNFEKIWPENSEQAKRYFLSEYYPLLLRNSHLSRAMEAFSSQFGWPASPCKHYCAVIINKNTNIFVYDFKRIKQQCVTCSLDHDPSKEIPRCYAMVDFHSPSFCKTQETENLFQ